MGVRISPPVPSAFKVQRLQFKVFSCNRKLRAVNRKRFTMNKISNYFRDSYKELTEKVTWPNWMQLQQSTMIVLAATLMITAIVAVMDLVSASGLKFIYKIF